MKELLTKAIGLLFSIEHEDFRVERYDVPLLYSNKGVFEICYGDVKGNIIEVIPMRSPAQLDKADWYVIVFVEKKKTRADVANTVLVKNDEGFKLVWENANEFSKHIKFKLWMDILKTDNDGLQSL